MSQPSARPIAFNRRLRAAWLKEGLRLLAEGVDESSWLERMESLVSSENKGRDSIKKSMRYLRHICLEPGEAESLRAEAIRLFSESTDADRDKVLSWGLAAATYPFLNDVAATIGRMLRVQPEMKLEQLLRKLCESFGEKETVRRSGRYSLGLIVELDFLVKTGAPGGYEATPPIRINDGQLASWLIRAWFLASQKSGSIDRVAISSHPSLAFFDAKPLVDAALVSGTLALERMSFSQETVRLVGQKL